MKGWIKRTVLKAPRGVASVDVAGAGRSYLVIEEGNDSDGRSVSDQLELADEKRQQRGAIQFNEGTVRATLTPGGHP